MPKQQEVQLSDDEARAARIKKARFDRGIMDGQMGEPPTEGSSEYQEGYEAGVRSLPRVRARHVR